MMRKTLYLLTFSTMFGFFATKKTSQAAQIALTPENTAVILVDLQYDFTQLPFDDKQQGSLAVTGANQAYVDQVKEALNFFNGKRFSIIATQDWHPAQHVSFASAHSGEKEFTEIKIDSKTNKKAEENAQTTRTQMLWPDHCVQDSKGAELVAEIKDLVSKTVQKGTTKEFDSYSGFEDDGGTKTKLDDILKEKKIKNLIVFGLATDYCVNATAQHGVKYNYKVWMVEDLSKGIGPDSIKQACDEMEKKGVKITTLEALKPQIK